MGQFEYNDLRKFKVSVGVFLIGLTFILPWLYMREQFDLTISEKELNELTLEAQDTIRNRQKIAGLLNWFIPICSLISLFTGIYLTTKGIKGWKKHQEKLDEGVDLTNKELSLKINKLTPAEHEASVKSDIKNQQKESVKSEEETESYVTRYLEAENSFTKLIEPVFTNNYRIILNSRIDGSEYDVVLRSPLKSDQDIIMEIKYSDVRVGGNYFHHSLDELRRKLVSYQLNVKENSVGRLVFLLPNSALHNKSKHPNSIYPSKTINLLDSKNRELKGTDVRIAYINMDELSMYNSQKILESLSLKVKM